MYQILKRFLNWLWPSKKQEAIEMKPVASMYLKSEYKKPETRPQWVKGIFDDYIYGRVRSLTCVREKIKETELKVNNRYRN